MCDFKWWDLLVAFVIIVFTLWTPGSWAKWLVVLAGVFMLYHAFRKSSCCETEAPVKGKATKKKK